MNKLMSLTDAQRAAIPGWAAKWIAEGLRTDAANRPQAEAAIAECYRLSKLIAPKRFVWVNSPIVGAFAFPICAHLLKVHSTVHYVIYSAVGSAVRSAVRSAIGSAVGSASGSVDSAVGSAVGPVGFAIHSAIHSAVGSVIHSAIHSVAGSAIGSTVHSAIYSAVDSAIYSAIGSAVDLLWGNYMGGNFWCSWQAFESFLREICCVNHSKSAEAIAYQNAQTSCCWWWPHSDFVMVCDRPAEINRNDRGQLHSTAGMSISFRDGWGLYTINGVEVTKKIVESPQTITFSEIEAEKNQEVRRIMIERRGWPWYLKKSKARVLDTRKNEIEGTVESLMATANDRVLICACPSTAKIFSLQVPPTVSTCEAAQTFLSGGLSRRIISAS